ncbi:hypothetical protein HDV04_005743 [Boothiomyces sp. JEL0838]|nr:hypothetical protein HDV04_005743 [Boothiomyces sp. JEL0838]
MDFCNVLSGIALGMTLNDIGLSQVIKGKRIPTLMFVTAITALIYVLGAELLIHANMDSSSTLSILVGVLMNFCDAISTILFSFAMISRLVAILPAGPFKKYLYFIMIIPLTYPAVDIYAAFLLIGLPLSPNTSIVMFAIGNFACGLTFFTVDLALTMWLVKHKNGSIRTIYYFPFVAGLLYMGVAIGTAANPSIDSAPIYLAYSLDILAYQQVLRNLVNGAPMKKGCSSMKSSFLSKNRKKLKISFGNITSNSQKE